MTSPLAMGSGRADTRGAFQPRLPIWSRGRRRADPSRLLPRKLQKSLDFGDSILQHYGLSEFALPSHQFQSHITVRPNVVFPIPACCAHRPTARPHRQSPAGRWRGGPPEMSKKTLETGSLRAVSDTMVRTRTGGSRNF